MYADDLILISTTQAGLQKCLDKLHAYCKKWGLIVNMSKTNILIFNKSGRTIKSCRFSYGHASVEPASEYTYLGLKFQSSGKFTLAVNQLKDKALKAYYK